MPNTTEIECYFKSEELAAICKTSKDVVIRFTATYPPNAKPVFTITANGYTRGAKTGTSAKGKKAQPLGDGDGGSTGCPKPC
jgi:hypothetical protein